MNRSLGTISAVEFARLALDSHRSRRGLERDPETVFIHLLADLIEWCDCEHVDLDASLSSAREMLRDCAEAPDDPDYDDNGNLRAGVDH